MEFQERTGESRRRASYSTTMSLPDTDTVPRPRGQTLVSILNVVPSPGIFAKICWCRGPSVRSRRRKRIGATGRPVARPRSIRPPGLRADVDTGASARRFAVDVSDAIRCRTGHRPGGRSETGHTVICFAMPASSQPPTGLGTSLSTCPRPHPENTPKLPR